MDGFQRRTEQKKTAILESALQLFLKYGIQKVSISEIAKKANVSQVTIYNYFESKHNLVNETFSYYVNKEWKKMLDVINSDLPYLEKIKRLIFRKKEASDVINFEFYENFMKDFSAGGSFVENLYLKDAIPIFMEFINEGKEKGYVDPNLPNEAIILYLQLINIGMQREEFHEQLLQYTEEITKLVFYGIVGERNK